MSTFSPRFIAFSQERKRTQGEDLQRWAKQDENPLLKSLANEVLQAAQEKNQ